MSTKQKFGQDLVDDIANGRCVVFLGAGASASVQTRDGERIKDWRGFLQWAAEKVPDNGSKSAAKRLIKDGDFLMACEMLRASMDKEDWQRILREEFAKVGEPSELHKAVAALGQRIHVTTNFDKHLETAWGVINPGITHHPNLITRLDQNAFKALRNNESYIIKLHGSIDDPSTMIFARSDYNELAIGNWAYNEFLKALLLTHTFIFLGFSMADPAISQLVEQHALRHPDSRPHYIFVAGRIDSKLADISRKLRRLYIVNYSAADNHKELPELVNELAELGRKKRREIAASLVA